MGFPYTVTNPGKLQTFSKTLLPYCLLDHLTMLTAVKVASVSIEYLRRAACLNGGPDQDLYKRALSEKQIRYIDAKGIRKPFALIPIQVKVFLETLSSLGAIVAFQHLKDPSTRIFFKACYDGFRPIKASEIDENIPIGVFEVGLKPDCTMKEVKIALEKHGLKESVLHLASLQAPYDRASSTLEDVKDPQVLELIQKHRAMDLSLPFEIFHIHCATHKEKKG